MLGFFTLLVFLCLYWIESKAQTVVLGNEVLRRSDYELLKGEKVAVFTNPSGFFQKDLTHIVDDMLATSTAGGTYFEVVAILSPEHGFRGEQQAETADRPVSFDKETGLPVISAYKVPQQVLAKMLADMGVTTVVVDIQDVGTRLYTFIWTMYDVMTSMVLMPAADKRPRLLVLDRPNPLGGMLVAGPVLNTTCCASGSGKLPIPHVHGLTIGELSMFFADYTTDMAARLEVQVVKMEGWHRNMMWEETGLFWAPPSPNLPTPTSSIVYPASVFVEATTVSEGRGTTTPFEVWGAPFYDPLDMSAALNEDADLCPAAHACFRAVSYMPTFGQYNNTVCRGVQFASARSSVSSDPFYAGMALLRVLMDQAPTECFRMGWQLVWASGL